MPDKVHRELVRTEALHYVWWDQTTDPATTNPSDVKPGHLWRNGSTLELKERNTAGTGWDFKGYLVPAGPGVDGYVLTWDQPTLKPQWEVATGGISSITIKKDGATIGSRAILNFHEGTGITLTLADDAGAAEIDITAALASTPFSGAIVVRTTDQTGIVTATVTPITWESEQYDSGGYWASSPNPTRLTVPTGVPAGTPYLAICNVIWEANATGQRTLGVRINGVTRYPQVTEDATAAGSLGQSISVPLLLGAGDYIEFFVFQNSGANRYLDADVLPVCVNGALIRLNSLNGAAADAAPATIYVATTGNDTTGDGTSGAPYLTIGKALSRLPDTFGLDHTIDIADGTYAEGIQLSRFDTGQYTLKLEGNAASPTSCKLTGTVSQGSNTFVVLAENRIRLELEGIELEKSTATEVLRAIYEARVILDRCRIDGGTRGVLAIWGGLIEFQGNCTVEGWTTDGIAAFQNGEIRYTVAGTLTVTGPGTAGQGIHIAYASRFIIAGQPTGLNLTITGVKYGFQLGLHALFQHISSTGTITIDNASQPAASAAVQCTDHSSWSTNQAVVIDNFVYGWEANSISYAEAVGSRTLTNVTTTKLESQNSVVYLP